MVKEIEEEWLQDSRGQQTLSFALFTKLLHRIASHWAVHIDIDEYVDLLKRIYDRLIVKKVVTSCGENFTIVPTIIIEFP